MVLQLFEALLQTSIEPEVAGLVLPGDTGTIISMNTVAVVVYVLVSVRNIICLLSVLIAGFVCRIRGLVPRDDKV